MLGIILNSSTSRLYLAMASENVVSGRREYWSKLMPLSSTRFCSTISRKGWNTWAYLGYARDRHYVSTHTPQPGHEAANVRKRVVKRGAEVVVDLFHHVLKVSVLNHHHLQVHALTNTSTAPGVVCGGCDVRPEVGVVQQPAA